MHSKENKLSKFNITFVIFMIILFTILMNINILLAQESLEAGQTSGYYIENPLNFKIYTSGSNIIKFEVPKESHISISLFDEYENLVKLLLYDNIQPGIYEYDLTNQLPTGKYVCKLNSGDISESKDLVLK